MVILKTTQNESSNTSKIQYFYNIFRFVKKGNWYFENMFGFSKTWNASLSRRMAYQHFPLKLKRRVCNRNCNKGKTNINANKHNVNANKYDIYKHYRKKWTNASNLYCENKFAEHILDCPELWGGLRTSILASSSN